METAVLVNITHAARFTGISRSLIHRWLNDGTLTRHEDGIDLDELGDAIDAQRRVSQRPLACRRNS